MSQKMVVTVEPTQLKIKASEKVSANVTIRNRSEEMGNYALHLEGLPSGWAKIEPEQLLAFPLQQADAELIIDLPPDAAGHHLLTIRAKLQEDEGVEAQCELSIEVPPEPVPVKQQASNEESGQANQLAHQPIPPSPPRPHASVARTHPLPPRPHASVTRTRPLSPPPIVVQPPPPPVVPQPPRTAIKMTAELVKGANLPPNVSDWRLTLHNEGQELDTFAFRVVGIPPNWFRIQPISLTLHPDKEGTANLRVKHPPEAPANTYTFKVVAFSIRNYHQSAELELKKVIPPRATYTLSISPPEAESQGMVEFQVLLASDKNSNTDLWLELSASDQNKACQFAFQPRQLLLPAQQRVKSVLRVKPRTMLKANERRVHKFKVIAAPPLNPPQYWGGGTSPPVLAQRAPRTEGGLGGRESHEIRFTQIGASPLILELRPQVQAGDIEKQYMLRVINPGSVSTTVLLSASDPQDGCTYHFKPGQVTLQPRSQTQVGLKVKARHLNLTKNEKPYEFTVSAKRTGELVPIAQTSGRFTQQAMIPLTLVLFPEQQSSRGKADYFIKLTNRDQRRVEIELGAADEANALSFTFQPPIVQLTPGAEGQARLTVRPKDKLMPGEQRRVHKFMVCRVVNSQRVLPCGNGTFAQMAGFDWAEMFANLFRIFIWAAKWVIALSIILSLVTFGAAAYEQFVILNAEQELSLERSCSETLPPAITTIKTNNPNLATALEMVPTGVVCFPLDKGPLGQPSRTIAKGVASLVR